MYVKGGGRIPEHAYVDRLGPLHRKPPTKFWRLILPRLIYHYCWFSRVILCSLQLKSLTKVCQATELHQRVQQQEMSLHECIVFLSPVVVHLQENTRYFVPSNDT